MKKILTAMIVFALVLSMFSSMTLLCASAVSTIYIRTDGSIDPPTAPISTADNITYILTDNITWDSYVDGIVIERNNILVDGAGYTLQGLQQYGNFLSGFNLANVHNVTIKNTNIKSFDYGIKLTRGFGNTVGGNNLTNNKWDGVYLDDSDNNSVGNNTVRNGENCGISLGVTSCGNSFFGNNIADNGYAFALGQSSGNVFIGNKITNNGEGIRLDDGSVNNSIYHNTFINNLEQVRILLGNPINSWDNGYPSGGNYWSDYTGQDSFRGPYQSIPGSDGIGDTPYVIDTDNRDRYPFTSPQMITWEYVFNDCIQGTTLKISTDDKYFQFIGQSKDFGIKQDPNMKVTCYGILICYSDTDMSLVAIAGTGRFKFCTAIAFDKPTHKTYWLMWTPFLQGRNCDQ
jgi:parallel beta-helix repeat protein